MLLATLFPLLSLIAVPDMAALATSPTASLAPETPNCQIGAAERTDFAERLNQLRVDHGLSRLDYDRLIERAAAGHSLDMAVREELTHEGSDGKNFVTRLRRSNYEPLVGAENVAWNQRSNAEVIVDWHASPSHRAAMLDPDVSHFGIARACSRAGEPYWTLVLARPFGKA